MVLFTVHTDTGHRTPDTDTNTNTERPVSISHRAQRVRYHNTASGHDPSNTPAQPKTRHDPTKPTFFRVASYGQWSTQRGSHDDNRWRRRDRQRRDRIDNDNDGDDTDGAAADEENVDNIDDGNLPPRVGKRNDGCDKTKTKEEETVGNTHNNQTDHREVGGRWRRLRRR